MAVMLYMIWPKAIRLAVIWFVVFVTLFYVLVLIYLMTGYSMLDDHELQTAVCAGLRVIGLTIMIPGVAHLVHNSRRVTALVVVLEIAFELVYVVLIVADVMNKSRYG
jgi:hypothetical protein